MSIVISKSLVNFPKDFLNIHSIELGQQVRITYTPRE